MYGPLLARTTLIAATISVGWQCGSAVNNGADQPRNSIMGIGLGLLAGLIAAPWVSDRLVAPFVSRAQAMPVERLFAGTMGVLVGLLVGALAALPLSLLPWRIGHLIPVMIAILGAYIGGTIFLSRGASAVLTSRLQSIPKPVSGGHDAHLVDTSAIIDGRIAEIIKAGFLTGTLLIPHFILAELQHIADSSDPVRRPRGRRGLETLNRLKQEQQVEVEISELDRADTPEVDAKLVRLARTLNVPIITNDFNLNRVAQIQGVRVLNINELAHALRPLVLPGESMHVRIVQGGRESNQGVGYLDDGTMIVVENGRRHMQVDIEVVVNRVLQTAAGRMIFASPRTSG